MSRLIIYRDGKYETEHVLLQDTLRLGRHSENDIVLNDLTMSRFHARMEKREDNYVLVDLNAQNGILLNGNRVEGEHTLRHGDSVCMGHFEIVYQQPDVLKTNAEFPKKKDDFLDSTTDFDYRKKNAGSDGALSNPLGISKGGATQSASYLVLLQDDKELERFEMGDEMVVGRSDQCEITIPLTGLSRRHARVYREGKKTFVADLDSQNGTWVDYKRIREPVELTFGAIINFYEYSLVLSRSIDEKVVIPATGQDHLNKFFPSPAKEAVAATKVSATPPESPDDTVASRPPSSDDSSAPQTDAPSSLESSSQGGSDLHPSFSSDDPASDTGFVFGAGSFIEEENLLDDGEQSSSDLSGSLISALEEEAFPEFENENTLGEHSNTITSGVMTKGSSSASEFGAVSAGIDRGETPTEEELSAVLRQVSDPPYYRVEVFFKGSLYTQMLLSQPIVRLGTDAGCELAMPRDSDLRPWHVTFINYGSAVICSRASPQAAVTINGAHVDSIVMRHDDRLELGDVAVVFREE